MASFFQRLRVRPPRPPAAAHSDAQRRRARHEHDTSTYRERRTRRRGLCCLPCTGSSRRSRPMHPTRRESRNLSVSAGESRPVRTPLPPLYQEWVEGKRLCVCLCAPHHATHTRPLSHSLTAWAAPPPATRPALIQAAQSCMQPRLENSTEASTDQVSPGPVACTHLDTAGYCGYLSFCDSLFCTCSLHGATVFTSPNALEPARLLWSLRLRRSKHFPCKSSSTALSAKERKSGSIAPHPPPMYRTKRQVTRGHVPVDIETLWAKKADRQPGPETASPNQSYLRRYNSKEISIGGQALCGQLRV